MLRDEAYAAPAVACSASTRCKSWDLIHRSMSYFVIHLVAGIIGETSPRLSMMALRAAAEGGREAIIDKAVCSPYSPP